MKTKFKQMQLQILDEHLASISFCERPKDGWIAAVRKGLGMSARQLAQRLGITQQAASEQEAREVNDTITLKSLRHAAEMMDCQLVYALVPRKGKLKDIIGRQALKKAQELVEAVDHTMILEAQGVGDREEKIMQVAAELITKHKSRLWD